MKAPGQWQGRKAMDYSTIDQVLSILFLVFRGSCHSYFGGIFMVIFCVVDSIEEVKKDTPYIPFDEDLHNDFWVMKEYGKLKKELYVLADLSEYADTKIENNDLESILKGIEEMQKEDLLPTVKMFLDRLKTFAEKAMETDKSLMAIGD